MFALTNVINIIIQFVNCNIWLFGQTILCGGHGLLSLVNGIGQICGLRAKRLRLKLRWWLILCLWLVIEFLKINHESLTTLVLLCHVHIVFFCGIFGPLSSLIEPFRSYFVIGTAHVAFVVFENQLIEFRAWHNLREGWNKHLLRANYFHDVQILGKLCTPVTEDPIETRTSATFLVTAKCTKTDLLNQLLERAQLGCIQSHLALL